MKGIANELIPCAAIQPSQLHITLSMPGHNNVVRGDVVDVVESGIFSMHAAQSGVVRTTGILCKMFGLCMRVCEMRGFSGRPFGVYGLCE
ncbi:unnamed protein product [Sphenostylis stenocarpa]|uniref:Uncharacterized protein n=1 Tax=Sphenostylis stenocarpa TaxID=92480 RepID=A0AA86SE78_9FABA|nr:unnamed protein product [Sphenostylis stenocarpa]